MRNRNVIISITIILAIILFAKIHVNNETSFTVVGYLTDPKTIDGWSKDSDVMVLEKANIIIVHLKTNDISVSSNKDGVTLSYDSSEDLGDYYHIIDLGTKTLVKINDKIVDFGGVSY